METDGYRCELILSCDDLREDEHDESDPFILAAQWAEDTTHDFTEGGWCWRVTCERTGEIKMVDVETRTVIA